MRLVELAGDVFGDKRADLAVHAGDALKDSGAQALGLHGNRDIAPGRRVDVDHDAQRLGGACGQRQADGHRGVELLAVKAQVDVQIEGDRDRKPERDLVP